MKIVKLLALVLVFLSLFSCQQSQSNSRSIYDELVREDDEECVKETVQIITFLAELVKIRTSDDTFMDVDSKEIRQKLEKIKDKEDLFDLARVLKILERNSTNNDCLQNNIERVYSHAFWHSIEILAQDRSEKNLEKLEQLKIELSISGGGSYNWSTIVYRISQP
jgi:hypothetical protein